MHKLLLCDSRAVEWRLLLLGGPGDERMVEELRMASARGRYIDLTGKVDLLTSYAALKRADLFIGNDSGLMHIAAAAGVPTLGLFGPSDERRYAPWGPDTMAVRGPRGFDQFVAVDPDLSQAIRHMSDLPVATVVRAAKALLERVRGKAEVEAAIETVPAEPAIIIAEDEAVSLDTLEESPISTVHPRESGDPGRA